MPAPRVLAFRVTTGLGAFLLFLVQPLIARQIVPWFGGGPAVWSACLLFFQLALVGGYFYAHWTRRLGPRRQAWLHLALLAGACLTLPIVPSPAWKPPDGSEPVLRVLMLLGASVGVPFVLLAATAPLVQDWLARARPSRTPYRLYVISNIGSLAALVAYPSVVEPNLALHTQSVGWSILFVVFVACCAWTASQVVNVAIEPAASLENSESDTAAAPIAPPSSRWDPVLWVVLPAITSGLLLATTSHLSQDIAAVPLIWMVPFTIYLMTYIATFAGWHRRGTWRVLLLAAAAIVLMAATGQLYGRLYGNFWLLGANALTAFTAACMVCHAELVRRQPPVRRLTAYYLAMSMGGAIGGAFVAVVAPLVFDAFHELPLLLVAACGVVVLSWLEDSRGHARRGLIVAGAAVVGVVFAAGVVAIFVARPHFYQIARARSFYGVLRVDEEPPSAGRPMRGLYHGRILHGSQFVDPVLAMTPTTYYAPGSGIETAIAKHPRRLAGEPMAIGAVGLGTGTIAAFGRRGDLVRFFEIDPLVVTFAREYFTYLDRSLAKIEVRMGDARLSLERQIAAPDGRHLFDVLAVDAFSGDSIPIHLLTRESFAIYREALKPDGILVVHISNQFLDLRPVVYGLAEDAGWEVVQVFRESDLSVRATRSNWLLVTTNREFLDAAPKRTSDPPAPIVWTDSFSSLLSVLHR